VQRLDSSNGAKPALANGIQLKRAAEGS
jgi:hypothetical protein